jgi:hypothetical protein
MTSLRQATGFRFHQLIGAANGGGAALADDADPDGDEPDASRVTNLADTGRPDSGFLVWALDGTSINARPWAKVLVSDAVSLWLPVATAAAVTTGATPTYILTGPIPKAAIFMALDTNVGNVKRVGWVYS